MRLHEAVLIVVVAGLLIFLVSGAASGSRASHAALCRNSLKAVYRMAEQYSADNNGMIVRMLDRNGAGRVVFWSDQLRDYAKDFRDFSCPANEKRGARSFEANDLLATTYLRADISFGINGHISGMDRRSHFVEKTKNLYDPSYTVYFGDSFTMRLRAVRKLWLQDWAPVHDNGMQAVMADGHIEYFTQETLGTYGKIDGWKRDTARWKKWKMSSVLRK